MRVNLADSKIPLVCLVASGVTLTLLFLIGGGSSLFTLTAIACAGNLLLFLLASRFSREHAPEPFRVEEKLEEEIEKTEEMENGEEIEEKEEEAQRLEEKEDIRKFQPTSNKEKSEEPNEERGVDVKYTLDHLVSKGWVVCWSTYPL